MNTGAVILTVDFESCDAYGTWIAYAAGIFSYPSGKVLRKLVRYIRRPIDQYDYKRKAFWLNKQRVAHDFIQNQAWDQSQEKKLELELVNFVREAHRQYPQLQVVSDHPTFDLRILDNMLQKHSKPLCTERHNGNWHHPVCTFTYGLSVQEWGGYKNIDALYQTSFGTMATGREVDGHVDEPLHTPWRDVMRIVGKYFKVLDIVGKFKVPYFPSNRRIKS
jgi:hypothetical protein